MGGSHCFLGNNTFHVFRDIKIGSDFFLCVWLWVLIAVQKLFSLSFLKRYSHYGEQCGDSFKNWKQNCLMTQQSHCWAYTPRKPELKETRAPQCSSAYKSFTTLVRFIPKNFFFDAILKGIFFIYFLSDISLLE